MIFLRLGTLMLTLTIWTSCGQKNKDSTGNNKSAISTDISKLKTIINLDSYEPQRVEWKYWRIGADGGGFGPTDLALQAVLYFDKPTIEKIKSDYLLLSSELKNLDKDDFYRDYYKFDWLTKDKIEQIEKGDSLIYNPRFFQKGSLWHGGFIIIDEETVLLHLFST